MNSKSYSSPSRYLLLRMIVVFGVLISLLGGVRGQVHAASVVLFVISGGMTSGSCNSWANACNLQYALTTAVYTNEIWVQQGTYKPTTDTNRTISFVLKDNVSVYGGFVGIETLRSQRDTSASLTILSGDIGVTGDVSDNSYHVVIGSGTSPTTVLDGFTITLGYASGAMPNSFGAGMYSDGGNLTLNNVVFNNNTAFSSDDTPVQGGGLYNLNGSPSLTNIVFNGNSIVQTSAVISSDGLGGGMYNENGNPTLTNVTFSGNLSQSSSSFGARGGAGMENKNSNPILNNVEFINNIATSVGWPNGRYGTTGGGMRNDNSNPTLTNVSFDGNSALLGGGMGMDHLGTATLTNVTFKNNTVAYHGGGFYNAGSDSTLMNVTFSGNSAGLSGGGMMNTASLPLSLTNVTFSGNQAGNGGGISNEGSNLLLNNVTFNGNVANFGGGIYGGAQTISNGIFWGNSSEIELGNQTVIKDSVIFAGCPMGSTCTNIIDIDPKLGALANNGGTTQTMSLGFGSSAIDSGGKNSTCAPTDQRGVTRPQGSGCDIGAFEVVDSVLVNSVLPTSRNVTTGTTATIFNTVINVGTSTAIGVTLGMVNPPSGTFAYQQTDCTTNAVIGPINPVLDLPGGGSLCYVLIFTPNVSFSATSVHIRVWADFVPSTTLYPGVNTWLLRATNTAGPDIIALTTTTDFHQVACSGAQAFAVALSNVGAAAMGDITVTANTGSASLPISVSILETNPGTGAVIGDHILNNLGAGENRTVAVFVTFNGCINFDPAANRIFIEFRDASNNVVGSTSTAVSTNR